MRDHGAAVVAVPDPNRALFQAHSGVPASASSCHTAQIGEYVIEGHVPVEAITRLLADQPEAVGLVNPGMPADSPGMGGDENTWRTQEIYLIGADGSLTPFDY